MTRVVSRATCRSVEPGERLRAARERAKLSRAVVADRAGYSVSGIGALENGQNNIKPDVAKVLAPIVGTTPEWLLYGTGDHEPRPARATVPVVGYVQAGAEAILYAEGQGPFDEVPAPHNASPRTVALQSRGESLGPLLSEWLVFYDDVRSPITPDMFGKLCVLGLPDGRVVVKQLKPAGVVGRYHLISQNEGPMLDQEVAWGAVVTAMTPR